MSRTVSIVLCRAGKSIGIVCMSSRSSERLISPGSFVSDGDPKRRDVADLRVLIISREDDAEGDSNRCRLFVASCRQSLLILRLMGAATNVNDGTSDATFWREPSRKEANSNEDDGEEWRRQKTLIAIVDR